MKNCRISARPFLRVVVTVLAMIAGLLPMLAGATTAQANATCTPDPVLCPASLYFGVSLPGLPRDLTGLRAFGDLVGKQPTVGNYFAAFGDQLDSFGMTQLAGDKRLPMLTWSPDVKGNLGANPYPLSGIAAGTFDTYLKAQAKKLAVIPGHVVVRFAHEMNGNWFPWGRGVNANTDADYVAAFRHVHDVVKAAGATNVIWMWAPGVSAGPVNLAPLYPGAKYVDWVGLSLYFDHATDTFAALVPPTIANIDTFAGEKPIFSAETGVLPGSARPAQITDLVSGLLRTPRLVGFAWFEEPGRFDWRVSADPTSVAALSAALQSQWIGTPGVVAPPQVAPLYQTPPTVTGTVATGETLTGTLGQWRSGADTGGIATLTGSWYSCSDPGVFASCVPIAGATAATYVVTDADWGTYLRYHVIAVNTVGSTEAFSVATTSVITRPATPAALTITSASTVLKVTFPAVPFGATHWILTVNAVAKVPEPVSTTAYYLVGLTNGVTYTVTLAAADMIATDSRTSDPLTATAVPMGGPFTPYIVVNGTSAVFTLPATKPAGAAAWALTIDGAGVSVPMTTPSWTAPNLATGVTHSWSLAPVSGTGPTGGPGAVGAAASGTFVPVDPPAAPAITPVPHGATFTFPALPTGATGWQLTVGPTAYPTSTAPSITATGLASGYPGSWSLRAVNSGARSVPTTGRFTPG